MIKITKVILLFLLIFVFIFTFILLQCLFVFFRKKRTYFISRAIHIFSVFACIIMGIKIKIKGLSELRKKRGLFLVTNHISYIDGIVASRIFPLVFIARGDLKEWPLFGIFSRASETVFINRTSYGNLHKEIENVSSLLKDGVNVILFPQGTTTSMIEEVSFRSSLFQAPIVASCDILPFTIKYKKINGQNIDDKNKDLVFWYGDMEFTPHLFSFFNLKSIEEEVHILSLIKVSSQDNRKAISMVSQEAINTNLMEGVCPN